VADLSISRAWDESRDIFRRDGGLIASVALALIVLPQAVLGLFSPQQGVQSEPSAAVQLLTLVVGLVALVGQLAIIRLAIGPSITVGTAIRHGVRRFPATFGAFLLLVLALVLVTVPVLLIFAVALGADLSQMQSRPDGPTAVLVLLLVLFILAISVRFTLLTSVATAEAIGPVAILKRAWALTRGNYWRLLGFLLLLIVAALVLLIVAALLGGFIARLISPDVEPLSLSALIIALFTAAAQGAFSILGSLMLARIYVQVAGRGEAEASVPTSGT